MFRSGRQALTILIFTGPGLQKPVAFQKMHVRWHPSVNSHTLKSSYWKSPLSWMIHQKWWFSSLQILSLPGIPQILSSAAENPRIQSRAKRDPVPLAEKEATYYKMWFFCGEIYGKYHGKYHGGTICNKLPWNDGDINVPNNLIFGSITLCHNVCRQTYTHVDPHVDHI
jgi:hypothetical protein